MLICKPEESILEQNIYQIYNIITITKDSNVHLKYIHFKSSEGVWMTMKEQSGYYHNITITDCYNYKAMARVQTHNFLCFILEFNEVSRKLNHPTTSHFLCFIFKQKSESQPSEHQMLITQAHLHCTLLSLETSPAFSKCLTPNGTKQFL